MTENGPVKINFINPLRNNVALVVSSREQRQALGDSVWQRNPSKILTRAAKEVYKLGYYSNKTAIFL